MQLQKTYLDQLPDLAIASWNSTLPPTIIQTTPKLIEAKFAQGIDLIIANLPTSPPRKTNRNNITPNPNTKDIYHIIQLIHHLNDTQQSKIGFLLANIPDTSNNPQLRESIGPTTTLDAPPCGSGAHRVTTFSQNLDSTQCSFTGGI
jgi:hypothetical protein